MILGLAGGQAGIVFGLVASLLAGYESFKLVIELSTIVYPTVPGNIVYVDGDQAGESKARRNMVKTVTERGKYWYSYREYMTTNFLANCCCCLVKNKPWFQHRMRRKERHEKAADSVRNLVDGKSGAVWIGESG